ncbi:hypothetical protein CAEBREN_18870 [Caenorhabditis brenneri]|uniref:Uncharacterized protein n=1 Tax=Caenorhabditis brenneri TaxID=135651 RepID=G0MW63_CAEBE|nr:hypothetical protein CAEBREN_18870 [Caenorhabditis brenneri]
MTIFILFCLISELGTKTKTRSENAPENRENPNQNFEVAVPIQVNVVQQEAVARLPPPRHIMTEDAINTLIAHNLRRDLQVNGLY